MPQPTLPHWWRTVLVPACFVFTPLVLTAEIVHPGLPDTENIPPATVEASGFQSLEGPVWIVDETGNGTLYFSDQGDNELWTWTESGGATIFRNYGNFKVNGNAVDNEGRLITCESGNRQLTRTELNGSITVLADRDPNEINLNEPNDVVVKSDGTIWFTTPSWSQSELDRQYVLRLDPSLPENDPDRLRIMVSNVDKPNGLVFSPDESILYLADNGANRVRRYEVGENGTLTPMSHLVTGLDRWPDGLEVDPWGNVFVAVHSGSMRGINIYSPEGDFLLRIPLQAETTNMTWGGVDGRTLFITNGSTLRSVPFPALPVPETGPADLFALVDPNGNLTLTWENAEDAPEYAIEMSINGGNFTVYETVEANASLSTSWEHVPTNATLAAQTLQFRVSGQDMGGMGPVSNMVLVSLSHELFRASIQPLAEWRQNGWLGYFSGDALPFVYTDEHGWWFTVSEPGSLWIYDWREPLGWIWTNAVTYPYIFRASDEHWLFYDASNGDWWDVTEGVIIDFVG